MSSVYTRPGVASSTSSHSARGLQVDYDLSFGSHPRSPSRYFSCSTLSHLSVRPRKLWLAR